MSTPYQVGETVEITINAPITYTSAAEEHVTPAELTVTLQTLSGPYDVTVPMPSALLPGEPVGIRRRIPAEGEPRPGDVWQDSRGGLWFAVQTRDRYGNTRVRLTGGADTYEVEQVHRDHVLIKLLFRTELVQAVAAHRGSDQ